MARAPLEAAASDRGLSVALPEREGEFALDDVTVDGEHPEPDPLDSRREGREPDRELLVVVGGDFGVTQIDLATRRIPY